MGVLGSDGDEEATVIEVSRPMEPSLSEGRLRLDRTRSSLAAGGSGDDALDVDEKSGPVPMTDGHVRLRVLADRSAVEIFANGKPLTARVYPTLGGGHVSLAAAAGTVRLLSLDAWTMKDIFEDARPLFP